jgi:hypothetical protein
VEIHLTPQIGKDTAFVDGSDLISEQHYMQNSHTRMRLQFLQVVFETTAMIITALAKMHMWGLYALDATAYEALILF